MSSKRRLTKLFKTESNDWVKEVITHTPRQERDVMLEIAKQVESIQIPSGYRLQTSIILRVVDANDEPIPEMGYERNLDRLVGQVVARDGLCGFFQIWGE
jgi:hypothetical protein